MILEMRRLMKSYHFRYQLMQDDIKEYWSILEGLCAAQVVHSLNENHFVITQGDLILSARVVREVFNCLPDLVDTFPGTIIFLPPDEATRDMLITQAQGLLEDTLHSIQEQFNGSEEDYTEKVYADSEEAYYKYVEICEIQEETPFQNHSFDKEIYRDEIDAVFEYGEYLLNARQAPWHEARTINGWLTEIYIPILSAYERSGDELSSGQDHPNGGEDEVSERSNRGSGDDRSEVGGGDAQSNDEGAGRSNPKNDPPTRKSAKRNKPKT